MRNIKKAFATINVEDSLKSSTLVYLYKQMPQNTMPRRYPHAKGRIILVSCLLLFVLLGLFTYNLYYTSAAYVDFDINPSIALSINRFDRVIDACAYNSNGESLLEKVDLQHKKIDAAVDELLVAAGELDILKNNGLVSITLQSDSGDQAALLASLKTHAANATSQNYAVEVDVFSVDAETRSIAHGLHISPAKYLAILELQAVDPQVTVEECKHHTIGEIRQMTHEHEGQHHNNGNHDDCVVENNEEAESTGDSGCHHGSGHH